MGFDAQQLKEEIERRLVAGQPGLSEIMYLHSPNTGEKLGALFMEVKTSSPLRRAQDAFNQELLERSQQEAVGKIDKEIQDEQFRAAQNPTMHSTLCQIARTIYGELKGPFTHMQLINDIANLKERLAKAEDMVARQGGQIHTLREQYAKRGETLGLINALSEVA